jgi:preprotein translocase subunit SecG
MVAVSMILLILLQRSEGGALGMGGGGGFVTGRGAANLLTRTTAILAAIFFTTSLALGVLGHRQAPTSAVGVSLPSRQGTPENAEKVPSTLPTLKIPLPQGQTPPAQAPAATPPAQPQLPQSQ